MKIIKPWYVVANEFKDSYGKRNHIIWQGSKHIADIWCRDDEENIAEMIVKEHNALAGIEEPEKFMENVKSLLKTRHRMQDKVSITTSTVNDFTYMEGLMDKLCKALFPQESEKEDA